MCGILGGWRKNSAEKKLSRKIYESLLLMAHRGRDDADTLNIKGQDSVKLLAT